MAYRSLYQQANWQGPPTTFGGIQHFYTDDEDEEIINEQIDQVEVETTSNAISSQEKSNDSNSNGLVPAFHAHYQNQLIGQEYISFDQLYGYLSVRLRRRWPTQQEEAIAR